MAQTPASTPPTGWWEASGLPYIFRTVALALQPSKLGLALVALLLTFVWGGALDWLWARARGIEADALTKFIAARELGQPYVEGPGAHGPFEIWRDHAGSTLEGFLATSVPGLGYVPARLSHYEMGFAGASPVRNLILMEYGCWWMFRHHPFFSILFWGGALFIWSLIGGAICRLAATQLAREEKLTATQGLVYARRRIFGGFMLAPMVPIGFVLITALLMAIGGMLLRIPGLDMLMGLAFPLAIIGGFVVAILLIGLLLGGSLFWPAVAAEGSDGFDAFSRGLSYVLSRPWKAVLYAILMVIYGAICWLIANCFVSFALMLTRGIVGAGAAWFGLWNRPGTPISGSKLNVLWPTMGPSGVYAWPDWSQLAFYEKFTALMIGICVLIVLGLLWAFLASFYLSGSTVIYFLLRRDVDGTDMDEVLADEQSEVIAAPAATPAPSKDVSLPIADQP